MVIGVYRGTLTIAGDAHDRRGAHRQAFLKSLTVRRGSETAHPLQAVLPGLLAPILQSREAFWSLPHRLTLKNFGGGPLRFCEFVTR